MHKKVNRQNKKWRKCAPSHEVVEAVLFQCNLADTQYQQNSEVLNT